MTVARVDLLLKQLDITWALFEHHLQIIDDEGCLWEPAPHCWTVRQDEQGRWVADWQVPEPDPVPAVTIAWVTWHIGYWWTSTIEACFGKGAPDREKITWPGGTAAAADRLRGLKADRQARLGGLTDADLDSTERTSGLPWEQKMTLGDVAGRVTVELTKNVAEIGLVRNLHGAVTKA
mgnify:CR=1 FL=1